MSNEINLKAKNTPQLWVFLSANMLFLFGMFFPEYFLELTNNFNIFLILKILGVSIAPLLLFLLNGLLPSTVKAILVYWKLKYPLPGSRAFSKLSKKDHRVNRNKLKQTYGNLPTSPSHQNRLWYQIYRKNSSEVIVQNSHKAFLLARDLTSLSVLFLIFLGIPVLILGSCPLNVIYFFILLLQYLIVCINAQNRGIRFVTNVLALESSS
ncbi:hypothetical protein [Gelidibacter japonicus]|uniref:hypothetical protein n=1 Tax=Gelidibacter japonicus TaxID=1962232 RepID=UPI0013D69BB4|nr:hypothetical protein [Gelidibacter japonicus]